MTTIAYRGGVLAADSGSWAGDASHGWARKVARGPDGTLYGVSGDASQAQGFLDWVEGGCIGARPVADKKPDQGSSFIVLAVPVVGKLRLITAYGEEKYEAPYYAIGAGAPTAFGALFAGASAEQAIEAAKEHASGAFGAVQTVTHQGA